MLDPFTSLSLAGNIVQFVNLGQKILANSCEIYKTGTSEDRSRLKEKADDLQILSNRIAKEAAKITSSNSAPTAEDQSLKKIAEQTFAVSKDFLEALGDVDTSGKRSKVKSVRQAIQNVVSEDKVKEISQRLDTLRSELTLRVLVSLRSDTELRNMRQDTSLESLEAGVQATVRGILAGNAMLTSKFDESLSSLTQQQIDHHAELLGLLSSLSPLNPSFTKRSQAELPVRLTPGHAAAAEDTILQQLNFRHRRDREENIDKAHKNTFQWILKEDLSINQRGTNFALWLRTGSGIYWIRGKAGSGKSTLMKMIVATNQTNEILQHWAGTNNLHIASFYFWALGTDLQKSQAGLLRSLLLSLLKRYRQLIEPSLPELYNEICKSLHDNHLSEVPPLTELEIRMAFLRLVKVLPKDLKICVFIDGLDEYCGHVPDILDLFLPVVSENFKMVISSRPIPSCNIAFRGCPFLRLEDLTKSDILRYTSQQISPHPNAIWLMGDSADELEKLIQEVTYKSSGVFLWVVLVVKILLRLLNDGDSIKELRRSLDAMPAELEPFYKHMMDAMAVSHRKQASWYLQLILRSIEIQDQDEMSLKQLWIAEEYGGQVHEKTDLARNLGQIEHTWKSRHELMESRLLSRCCGLVEIIQVAEESRIHVSVGFIHKTVADFLRQPHIWSYMTDLTKDERSDINQVLARSCLLYLQTTWPTPLESGRASELTVFSYMDYCLMYLRAGESSAGSTLMSLLYDFRQYSKVWSNSESGLNFEDCFKVPNDQSHQNTFLFPPFALDNLKDGEIDICITACAALPMHFEAVYEGHSKSPGDRESVKSLNTMLLSLLLFENRFDSLYRKTSLPDHFHIVKYLLGAGADPNAIRRGKTPWGRLLTMIYRYAHSVFAYDEEGGAFEKLLACLDAAPAFVRFEAALQDVLASRDLEGIATGNVYWPTDTLLPAADVIEILPGDYRKFPESDRTQMICAGRSKLLTVIRDAHQASEARAKKEKIKKGTVLRKLFLRRPKNMKMLPPT